MKDRVWLIIVLIAFLTLSVFTSFYYGERLLVGSLDEFNNDDVKYLRSAQTLLETSKFTYKYSEESTAFIMPGIVFVLVPFVKLFGLYGAITAFRIFSAFVQTITLFVFYLITKKVFDGKTGVLAAALMAVYIPNIYVTSLMLTETMFLFFFSLLVYFSIMAVEERKTRYYLIGGAFWGLCALFRPVIVLFPVVIGIAWLIKKYKLIEMIKFGTVTVIIFVIILLPWWIRNYIVFNRFIPFTLSAGNPALQGAFIDYETDWNLVQRLNTDNLQYTDNEIINNEIEAKFAAKVNRYNLKNNTWRYLKWVTIDKTIYNFRYPFCWMPLYGISFGIQNIQHYIYLSLGTVGFIIARKKDKKNVWIYAFIYAILYFNCAHLPFYCFSRYMYPIMPFFAIMSAYALLNIRRRKRYKALNRG